MSLCPICIPSLPGIPADLYTKCISELMDYDVQLENRGFFPAIDATCTVYKSDTLIDEAFRQDLCDAVAPLEAVPSISRDWHPESDEKVLDLVHPSLFPLIYGRSRILPDEVVPLDRCVEYTGLGDIICTPGADEVSSLTETDRKQTWHHPLVLYSTQFQWLPCEVAFLAEDSLAITSYINNLHPNKHKRLYTMIEKILAKALPMLEATLSSADSRERPARIDKVYAEYNDSPQEPPAGVPGEGELGSLRTKMRVSLRSLTMKMRVSLRSLTTKMSM